MKKNNHSSKKGKENMEENYSSDDSSSNNSLGQVHPILLGIHALQFLVSLVILFFLFSIAGTSTQSGQMGFDEDKLLSMETKLTNLDRFFAINFPGEYGDSAGAPPQQQPSGSPSGNNVVDPSSFDLSDVRSVGDVDAPITIVKYSDFACGFCGRFHFDTFYDLKREYIDTGLVRFVYKDMPVVGGQLAANAGWCAYEQDMFWEYHNVIFENSRSINSANLKTWAVDLGMDSDKFNDCLDSQKYNDKVMAEAAEGRNLGVTGTPAFFINGQLLVGAQPLVAFKQVIDSQLS